MTLPAVSLRAVTLAYGDFVAVRNVDLDIDKGSFVTLLGPSGCGKTTILRSIAGLVQPTAGDISIAGRLVNDVPIHKRNIGLVFQNYALFPHKSIFDNVAFGLKYRGAARSVIAEKVTRALATVRLPGVEKKLPSELSGGQQQRIALARAIVIEPDVLLLDEPLSALDAHLREEMRIELKAIQREVGITTIFVTHDQEEALALSDRIIVMNHGVIEQSGTPEEVYRRPETKFVAGFLGQSNMLAGTVAGSAADRLDIDIGNGHRLQAAATATVAAVGATVTAVIRAQRIGVLPRNTAPSADVSGGNRAPGRILATAYLGGTAAYQVKAFGQRLQAVALIDGPVLREGDLCEAVIAPADIVLLNAEGRRLG